MVPRCSTTCRAVYRRVVPANRGLSNHFWVSAISCSNKVMSALPLAGRNPHEHRSSWRCHPLGESLIGAPHQELTALFNESEALYRLIGGRWKEGARMPAGSEARKPTSFSLRISGREPPAYWTHQTLRFGRSLACTVFPAPS